MTCQTMRRLCVVHARQVVMVVSDGRKVVNGRHMASIDLLQRRHDNDGLSVVVDSKGNIEAIGYDDEIEPEFDKRAFEHVLDASGKCIIPGFVDAHTHSLWAGDRVHEFALKLGGATYMDIYNAGGGIHFTVDHVRRASEDDLLAAFKVTCERMVQSGTTLLECKSGYGLDLDTELKMLRVIDRARDQVTADISSTYCGAHAVPKGRTSADMTNDVISNHLPAIKRQLDAGLLRVDAIDVFCEKGVYDVDQSRRILEAGQAIGLAANFHGEELSCLHSAEMAADIKARAVSHLEEVSGEGMRAMAAAGTVGIVLPTTAYCLRIAPPPVRAMIDTGMALALGSDFNPNAHCFAMPMVMNLACIVAHMTLPEALVAATINAAAALGRSDVQGSLECGKMADMVVLDAPSWEHIVYQMGNHHHIISDVIKAGRIVYTKK